MSVLDEKGTPSVVERAFIYPPRTQLAPLTADERAAIVRASALRGHYEQPVDRDSAFERLSKRAERATVDAPPASTRGGKTMEDELTKAAISVGTSVVRSMGTQAGRSIVRRRARCAVRRSPPLKRHQDRTDATIR